MERLFDFKILEVSEFMRTISPNTFEPMIRTQVTFDDDIKEDRATNVQFVINQIIMNSV